MEIVPMTLIFDGINFKDGVDISKKEFYHKLKNSIHHPGSASPSPGDFINTFHQGDNIFVFTVSSALSSSYNNAVLAKNLYAKQFTEKAIHVFDSLNASIGQGLAIIKLRELIENNHKYDQIISSLEEYIKEIKTFFILENMGNLINSGRLNKIVGKIVSALNIKLIMGKTLDGKIELFEKVRGSKKAFQRLCKIIEKNSNKLEEKILGIAHYNCLEKAQSFKQEVEKLYNFKDIIITQMGPTIATYADEGALLISF
ncbi:MAG: DegV family protein [Halanaerobiales bacterium]|nr:DegV family protein [Halanaerobiales bacterium]